MIGAVVQRVTSSVFVGREDEVDALLAALARAESGSASTVLVGGEAGIGKTRLLAELHRVGHARPGRPPRPRGERSPSSQTCRGRSCE